MLLVTATVLLVAAPSARPAARDTIKPAFETASVKLNTSGITEKGTTRTTRLKPGGGFAATNVTLRDLVEFAYQRHGFDRREVIGGPAWVDSDRFDVVAKAASEHVVDLDGSFRQTWSMLGTLLAQRFKLKVHEEKSDRTVYAFSEFVRLEQELLMLLRQAIERDQKMLAEMRGQVGR